jgi:tetratricopeptide (TPR) repeat protein
MLSEDRGELLRSISDVWAAGDWALEREDVERAPELIARSGRLAVRHSRVTETLTSIERALALPELPDSDSEWRFQLRFRQSQLLTLLGRFAEAFQLNESLISELRAAGRHQPLSAVLIQQAISSASTELADPFPLLGSALEAARAAADPELEIDALAQLGGFQLSAGHYAEAVATFDRAAALSPRGEPRSYVVASLQALAAVLSGDFERAGLLARISEPTRWSSEAPDPSTASTRASWLLASAASGDLEATAEQLRALVRFQRRVRAPLFDADLLGAAGAAACLLGDFERAGRLLGAARSEFGKHGSWRTQQGGAIYVHFTAQVRRALPADVAKRARDEGRALSVEQAFELALALLPAERGRTSA